MKIKQFVVKLSCALFCAALLLISQIAHAAEDPKSATSETLSYFNDTVHIDLQGRVKVKDSDYVQVPFTKQDKAIIQSESETDIKALLLGKKELASHHDEITDLEPADALLDDILIDMEDEYHDPVIQEENRKQAESKKRQEEIKKEFGNFLQDLAE